MNLMMHKIVHGVGDLCVDQWLDTFDGQQVTRTSADPLNGRARTGNLELRRGFFSNRVAQDWNNVPSSSDIKRALYSSYREIQNSLPKARRGSQAAPMIT
jgi:hypothetical protein